MLIEKKHFAEKASKNSQRLCRGGGHTDARNTILTTTHADGYKEGGPSPTLESTAMKATSPLLLQLRSTLPILLFLAATAAMASEPEQSAPAGAEAQDAAVHIVYVDRPEGAEAEEFHIRTLAHVLGR
jgi:hypothetical protein